MLALFQAVGSAQPLKIPTEGHITFRLKEKSKGDISLKGTAEHPAKYKYKFTLKDGTTMEGEFEGREITIKDKEGAILDVQVGKAGSLPSAKWTGTSSD